MTKNAALSLFLLLSSSASAQPNSVNMTENCDDQLSVIQEDPAVYEAWTGVENLMLANCKDNDEGCEEDKTGSQIIWTYDFANIGGSNETKAYDSACAGVEGDLAVVKTLSATPVIVACKAETANHIPYEVHLKDYFQCTGITCSAEDEYYEQNAVDFATKVIDEIQNGVTCTLGPHAGASALATGFAAAMATAGVFMALF